MPNHKIGIAVLSNPERSGVAIAVVLVDSGEVAAADGWYFGELPQDAPTLGDSLWEDWDDMPTKLLWRYNVPWFDSLLPYLLPHYSLAQAAAELAAHWAHDRNTPSCAMQTWLPTSPLPIKTLASAISARSSLTPRPMA